MPPPLVLLGDRGAGQLDVWVSHPGWDVRTAPYGRLLLGGSTGVNQIMAAGETLLHPGPSLSGGQYFVAAPPEIAGLSNLLVWGQLYATVNGAVDYSHHFEPNHVNHGAFAVFGGSVYAFSFLSSAYGAPATPAQLWASWAVFRAGF